MKYIVFIAVLFPINLPAQITVTFDDVLPDFLPRTYSVFVDSIVTMPENFADPGMNSWDFSHFNAEITSMGIIELPENTPFASEFPIAQFASYDSANVAWNYGNYEAALGFFNLGSAYQTSMEHIDPPELFLKVPLNYGAKWSQTFESEESPSSIVTTHVIEQEVDAFGDLILPDAASVEVLRVKKIETVSLFGVEVTGTSYQFWSKRGHVLTFIQFATGNNGEPVGTAFWNELRQITNIAESEAIPEQISLAQNYPNPFNPSTTISFKLSKLSPVTLTIYNVLGERVRILLNGKEKKAGENSSVWDGRDDLGNPVQSGMYFYRLQVGNQTDLVQKMTLLK